MPEERLSLLEKMLEEHMTYCKTEFDKGSDKFSRLEAGMAENTDAVRHLAESTRGVVQLQQDLQGAARIGLKVQSVMNWTVKWPLIAAGFWTAVKTFMDKLS